MTRTIWSIFALAALATFMFSRPAMHIAIRMHMIDEVRHRRNAAGIVPRGVGAVMVIAAPIAAVVAQMLGKTVEIGASLVAICAFGLLGLADDIRSRAPALRLATQTTIATAFSVYATLEILRGPIWISVMLCVVALVGFVNVFNFMDGIDGISGTTAVICGLWLVGLGFRFEAYETAALGALAAGAALGFLPYNVPVARAFLGDSGAYLLGSALMIGGLTAIDSGAPVVAVALPYTLYVADIGLTLARRALRGDSIFARHREYTFHRLATSRLHQGGTTILVGLVIVALVFLGNISIGRTPATQVLVMTIAGSLLLGYLTLPRILRTGSLKRVEHESPHRLETKPRRAR